MDFLDFLLGFLLELLVGFEIGTGYEVKIPLHHSVITGMTGVGKTSLIKRMIDQVPRGIVFDVKNDYTEYRSFQPRITTKLVDSLALKEILEVYGGMTLKSEFPELIKVTRDANDLREVAINIDKLLRDAKIHPVRKDKLLVIKDLLQRFLFDISPLMALKRPTDGDFMKIDISSLNDALQQFIVDGEIRNLRENYVVFIDEAHKFIPERGASIAKRSIINLLREGRSKGNFVILSDQTITGISKEALKQCWNWILGRQLEINEIKRVTEQTIGIRTTPEEIASLRVGEFIYFSPDEKIRFYSWPPFIDKEKAKERAIELGEKTGIEFRNPTGWTISEILDYLIGELNSPNKSNFSPEIIRKLEKLGESISDFLNKTTLSWLRKTNMIDERTDDIEVLILELVKREPGISFSELVEKLIGNYGAKKREVARTLRELIDRREIDIKSVHGDIKVYPRDDEYFFDIV